MHRSGYRAPQEAIATHARRRFRLTPLDPNAPPPDSSLWIIHYCQAEIQSRVPSNTIQIPGQVRHFINERMQLQQRHHQLVRKEFMLRDSASWPTINLPGSTSQQYPQQPMGYPGDVISHMNRSQQQVYMQQQQAQAAQAAQRSMGPSPAKRPRHGAPNHGPGSITAIPPPAMSRDPALEDEDGGETGDLMDFLTPRDISLHRYVQHHEWLEEVLHSPYDTHQIIPGELGLGKKGELESLTRDFFDAPTDLPLKENFKPPSSPEQTPLKDTATPRVGRLEGGQAEDFTKRANDRLLSINEEMESMKRQHAKRVAKLTKARAYKQVLEELRNATLDMINGNPGKGSPGEHSTVDQIVSKMEADVGRSIKAVADVECIDKGGLEEKPQSVDSRDQDYDMIDNFGNFNGAGSHVPTPPAPSNQPHANRHDTSAVAPQNYSNHSEIEIPQHETTTVADEYISLENKDQGPEEWVMVNENSASPETPQDQLEQDTGDLENFTNDAAMQPSIDTPDAEENTAGEELQEFAQDVKEDTAGNFEVAGFDEGIDFGDLDTAGDELAGYEGAAENPGLEEQGDMGPEDTAFGDAFPDVGEEGAQEEERAGS